MFKNHPSLPTKEDIFEQIVGFILSEQYPLSKSIVDSLAGKAGYVSILEAKN